MTRVGWAANSIKSGDEVTIIMHPLRDGTRGGTIVEVRLADGTILPSGGMRPDPVPEMGGLGRGGGIPGQILPVHVDAVGVAAVCSQIETVGIHLGNDIEYESATSRLR